MKTLLTFLPILFLMVTYNACASGSQKATDAPVATSKSATPDKPTLLSDNASTDKARTEGWNNYANEKFRYSIKYPKEATLKNLEPEAAGEGILQAINISLWGPTQKEDTEFYDGLSFDLFIKKLDGASLEAKVDEAIESAKLVGSIKEDKKSVEVGGRPAYQFTATGLGTFTYIFAPFKDDTYVQFVYSYGGAKSAEYLAMAKAIVQSFKDKG